MKKYLFLFISLSFVFVNLFFVNLARAITDNITQINFITNPQSISIHSVSSVLTIETQNIDGGEEALDTSGTILKLETTSPTGEFSSNATNWIPVSTFGMNKTWAHRNFYYKDETPGTYTLTISAIGKSWTPAIQTITINGAVEMDNIPPELNLPQEIIEEATDPNGAVVNFTVMAEDTNPTNPEVSCLPISGSIFPIGTTSVSCSATDNAGNTTNGSFNIIIKDTTAPTIIGTPLDIEVQAISDIGINVSYVLPTATDVVDGTITVSCLPLSDSLFLVGENIVNCSAVDSAGNTSSSSFKITVLEKSIQTTNIATKRSGSYIKKIPNTPIIPSIPKNIIGEPSKGEVLGVEKFNFTSDLYFGVKSVEVVELQKFLISKGYLKKGAFGGFFGKYTKEAVMKFQKANPPLWVDGIVGQETRAVLNQ